MKKTNKNMTMGMCLGMCFGVSIGTVIGQSVFDNMSTGTTMGLCLGMLIGMVIGAMKDKAVNEQIEEQGYVVKTITMQENEKTYSVVIENKNGNESIVIVPQGIMDEETFCVGDMVYLNEDGNIEQAYDKEEE